MACEGSRQGVLRKLLVAFALAAMLSAAIPGAAQAGGKMLSMTRAAAVAMKVAQKDCDKDPSCEGYGVRVCRRLTIRKVRCASRIEGVDSAGPYACERPVLVRRHRRTGKISYTTREQVCAHF